ncbi:uncharacterized protein LOC107884862 [Acyrthosiphon pisum]|uniref:Uncharacterized protein n=1 Tax=Acyrthosiphon pisum TaxID=7029 RepID=A0A8R2H7E5_ACYPI|nr:uncharacterized protein LOC107884862 [Acyrthosiphon pisum]|eukprot:XP_016663330.1 PREDICTED: uncharacterized protein LOC107884862 [Acyrthosiphon pisum]
MITKDFQRLPEISKDYHRFPNICTLITKSGLPLDVLVDSDVNEKTKNTTTSDKYPKYVDCNETLVELGYFKWITGFRSECRKAACLVKTELFFGLFYLFCKIILQDVCECRKKINKSSLVKSYLEQSMLFFQGHYKNIKQT